MNDVKGVERGATTMARLNHFDPRTLLKQIAIPFLQQFFAKRGELLDVPWKELREKKLIGPIYAAWQQLPEPRRREVHAILHEIVEASGEHGMTVFAQELRHHAHDEAWKFTACRSRLNKAMWFYLNFPQLFDRATLFACADSLGRGRLAVRRNDLPKLPIAVTPTMTAALAEALRNFYWPTQMRGHHCHVEHYTRLDGDEYFFAYLDDWPDKRFVFEDSGHLKMQSSRFAFSVLFVFSPGNGSLELIANGGEAIQYPLQRAFCKSVLEIDIPPAHPTRPVYRLQQVLDPSFTYPTSADDRIGRVQLKSIRWKPIGTIKKLRANVQHFEVPATRDEWLDLIRQGLAGYGLSATQAVVEGATFKLTMLRNGSGRARTVEFTINLPGRCNLRYKSEEFQAIGQRCLNLWGMIDA
jgi:hypothetical protein